MANINKWSKTAGNNATADPDINFAEGQAPSTVNNSTRFEMQGTANDRDDTRGQLTLGGGTTAYTLTTNSINTTLQAGLQVGGKMPSAPTGAMTLNVDGLGAKKCYGPNLVQINTGIATGAGLGLYSGQQTTWQYDTALDAAAGGWVLVSAPNSFAASGTSSPTAASTVGTITSVSATVSYYVVQGIVFISGNIAITTNGTGSSTITLSGLPISVSAFSGSGRAVSVSGKQFSVSRISGTSLSIQNYDNTYPGASGETLVFTGIGTIT